MKSKLNFTENFEENFKKIRFSQSFENSIKELSNWFLGISLGIFTILVFQLSKTEFKDFTTELRTFYIVLVFASILNLGLSGLCKYLLLIREYKINYYYSQIKKRYFFLENDFKNIIDQNFEVKKLIDESQREEIERKYNDAFEKNKNPQNEIINQLNRTSIINKILLCSIMFSFALIISISIFIIITI